MNTAGERAGAWSRVALGAGVAAVDGLLFGYDTGVISGAILYLRSDFGLNPTAEGLDRSRGICEAGGVRERGTTT